MSVSTQAVLDHHLQAPSQGIEAVMDDYANDSVLITDTGTYRGLEEIRGFFSLMFQGLPDGFQEAVKIRHQEVVDEVAFVVWEAQPWLAFCTDTLTVRDGKIVYQTFAASAAT